MYNFKAGLELNREFYKDVIAPLLARNYPDLQYSAALIGFGSDVLGLDTPTSMDHAWGPRCILFLKEDDYVMKDELSAFFADNLPLEFQGFPTNYSDPAVEFVIAMKATDCHPVRHFIEFTSVEGFFGHYVGISTVEDICAEKMLACTDQQLIEVTAGEVFHDRLGTLEPLRRGLAFYLPDVQKLKLAALWSCIANEEAFVGRSIDLDDFAGLKMISTRLVNMLMKICFYIEKRYIPYSKWFGSMARELDCADDLIPLVNAVLSENNGSRISDVLGDLYSFVIKLHNDAGLPKLENQVRKFHDRPYQVIFADEIVDTLMESIKDPALKQIAPQKIAMDIKLDSVDFTE